LRLVHELAADGIDVAVACRVLGVSRSGYYEWRDRPPSARAQANELLLKQIVEVHNGLRASRDSRQTYGWPRVHAELRLELGLEVNHKRVARLMREAGIQGLYRRRRRGCTISDPAADRAEDLVNRETSSRTGLTSCGSPTSPNTPPRRASCTARAYWMCGRD
jgi:putative transposase